MTDTTSLPLFLVSAIAISVTGVMMPGPVTAITVMRGTQRRETGAVIALGHGIIESLLILLTTYQCSGLWQRWGGCYRGDSLGLRL